MKGEQPTTKNGVVAQHGLLYSTPCAGLCPDRRANYFLRINVSWRGFRRKPCTASEEMRLE